MGAFQTDVKLLKDSLDATAGATDTQAGQRQHATQ